MRISFDWGGCYLEHRQYFDAMALCMQKEGHQVGIITGERTAKEAEIRGSLGFIPDFIALWGDYETIANSNMWKCQRMDQFDVMVHYDDDATEMKKYTNRWIIKVLNSGEPKKF